MDRMKVLLAAIANYEMQYSQGNLSLKDAQKYFKATEEYNFLRGLNILLNLSPESMNPKRISEHCEQVKNYLLRYIPGEADKIQYFCKQMEKYYLAFKPDNIQSYKNSIAYFIGVAIQIYNNSNKEE